MRSKTMKKTNPFYRFCALALSCLLLISLLPVTQVLADGDGAIHIKSAEDLRSLAHSCTLDSWSRGKTVVLDNDIELTDDDTLPIPTFGGTFNGNGHTISGLSITQSVSPAGLFGVLQKDAVIKNLNVEGTVTPSGDSENIGGIVGENHGTIESCTFNGSVSGKRSVGGIAGRNLATGIVRACEASGAIFGQSMTGGIVGENLGSIVSCRGRAYVNIESTDPSIDLSDLSLDFSLDLSSLSRLDTLNIATDTGGIAGYSSGAIASIEKAFEICFSLPSCGLRIIYCFQTLRRLRVFDFYRSVGLKTYRCFTAFYYDFYESFRLIYATDKFVATVSYVFHKFTSPFSLVVLSKCFREISLLSALKQPSVYSHSSAYR